MLRAALRIANRYKRKSWRGPARNRYLPRLVALEERVLPSVVLTEQTAVPLTTDLSRVLATPSGVLPQIGVSTGFAGVSLQDEYNNNGGSIPPDTMGAVGPSQFAEMINGRYAVYSKAGVLKGSSSLNTFWSVLGPAGGTFDPHILYDKHSGRWFAVSLDSNNNLANHLLVGVSKTSDAAGSWIEYKVQAAASNEFADYPTLGADDNGVYVGMHNFPKTGTSYQAIFAIQKSLLVAGKNITPWEFNHLNEIYGSPQPAYNFDTVASGGAAWFVSSIRSALGDVGYRTLTWSAGKPSLSASQTVVTPAFGAVLAAPTSGGTQSLDAGDHRLLMAYIRNKQLWTARTVAVNSKGAASNADRDAAEVIELNVSTKTAHLIQSDRAFDSAATNPRFYYEPSVMANSQGFVAVGFSGAKATEFVGAYTTGRLATDPVGKLRPVTLLKGGAAAYTITFGGTRNRWGDYSYTSLDPTDDKTIWTIQEYAAAKGLLVSGSVSRWGTWIAHIKSPAVDSNADLAVSTVGAASGRASMLAAATSEPGTASASIPPDGLSGTNSPGAAPLSNAKRSDQESSEVAPFARRSTPADDWIAKLF